MVPLNEVFVHRKGRVVWCFFFFLKAGGMSLVLMTFSDLIVGLVQLLQELGKGPAMTCHNMHIR